MEDGVCYEYPLNEQIRTLLRLDFLFSQFEHASAGSSVWEARAALLTLFDLIELASRSEIKSELVRELDRHATVFKGLQQNPSVNSTALAKVLEQLALAANDLRHLNNSSLENLRQNEFLSSIRQRSSIPGGTCAFDLPALHHWLQEPVQARQYHLEHWLAPVLPMQVGARLALDLVRNSVTPSHTIAKAGFFQETPESSTAQQLLRVIVPPELGVFPEISGGKHRFSIRFLEQAEPNQRALKTEFDVAFLLARCGI